MTKRAIIVKLAPYVGGGTWLDCGGSHLKERMKRIPDFDYMNMTGKVMYAYITIDDNDPTSGTSDFGYNLKEAIDLAVKEKLPFSIIE